MGVPYFTSFCCCLDLKTGAKLIGLLHLIVSITLLVLCSVFAEGVRGNIGTVEDVDHVYSTWYTIAVSVAVVSVVHVLLAMTLLVGIYKRSTVLIRAWVWVMLVLFGSAIFYIIVSMFFGMHHSGSDIFLAFLEGVLFFGAVGYCIVCVNSYYLVLRSAEDMSGPKNHI